jgi:hypothetical protein
MRDSAEFMRPRSGLKARYSRLIPGQARRIGAGSLWIRVELQDSRTGGQIYGGFRDNRTQHVTRGSGCPFWVNIADKPAVIDYGKVGLYARYLG